MDSRVIVAYASKYGATGEIAERIGQVLRQAGLQADVLPVKGLRGLDGYNAVVLGSAVYIDKWQKEAAAFLRANEVALAGRPVWLFSSGPTGEGDPLELVEGWRLPAALQPVAARIRPRDVAVFHGHINPGKLSFIEKSAVGSIKKKPFGDYRDWNRIVAWATTIADALKDGEGSSAAARSAP